MANGETYGNQTESFDITPAPMTWTTADRLGLAKATVDWAIEATVNDLLPEVAVSTAFATDAAKLDACLSEVPASFLPLAALRAFPDQVDKQIKAWRNLLTLSPEKISKNKAKAEELLGIYVCFMVALCGDEASIDIFGKQHDKYKQRLSTLDGKSQTS